jgi:hypothetical protein
MTMFAPTLLGEGRQKQISNGKMAKRLLGLSMRPRFAIALGFIGALLISAQQASRADFGDADVT